MSDPFAPLTAPPSRLCAYIGPGAEPFLKAWRRHEAGGRYGPSWVWLAFFLPLAWLGYRKMYDWLAALLWCSVAISLLVPQGAGLLGAGMSVAIAANARALYLRRAERDVARIVAAGLPPGPEAAEVARRGGRSRAGLLLGLAMTMGSGAVLALQAARDGTPGCIDGTTIALARRAYAARLGRPDEAGWVTLARVTQLAPPLDDGVRRCRGAFRLDGDERVINFAVGAAARPGGGHSVRLGRDGEG